MKIPEAIEGFLKLRCGVLVPVYVVLDLFYQSDDTYTYLLHAHEPIERSNGYKVQHYVGSTTNIDKRIKEHRRKKKLGGAALMREFNRRGIEWSLAKLWKANRDFEKRLKQSGHYERYCPLCQDVAF